MNIDLYLIFNVSILFYVKYMLVCAPGCQLGRFSLDVKPSTFNVISREGNRLRVPFTGHILVWWQVLARVYCAFAAVWSLGANLHEAGH